MNIDDFLKKIVGISGSDKIMSPRTLISSWMRWYQGDVPSVHKISYQAQHSNRQLEAKTLNMAQVVSEDWAGLIINDKTEIQVDDADITNMLLGTDFSDFRGADSGGVLGANNFWALSSQAIETGFALGTAISTVRLDEFGNIKIEFVPFDAFFPTSWDSGRVTECVILTRAVLDGKAIETYTWHYLDSDGNYVIDSYGFDRNNVQNYHTKFESKSDVPLFSIFSPNKANNTKYQGMPYGVSIFSGREGILTFIDSVLNMAQGDVEVGGLRMLITRDAVLTGEGESGGLHKTALDVDARQFLSSIETGYGETPILKEFNPTLQLPSQMQALDSALGILGKQVGLGADRYTLSRETATTATATAVKISSADQLRTISKHRLKAEVFLLDILRAVIYLDNVRNNKVLRLSDFKQDPSLQIRIKFDESFFVDEEEVKARDMLLVERNLMSKRNFLLKYGIATEDNVDSYLDELRADAPIHIGGY